MSVRTARAVSAPAARPSEGAASSTEGPSAAAPPGARGAAAAVGCACPQPNATAFMDWVGRLVNEHREHLLRVARREGVSAEDAFDAVQEAFQTFLTLPQARSLVAVREDSRRLLAVVTKNVARNRRRLHAVARPHLPAHGDGGELGDRDGDVGAVLASLPADGATIEELLVAAEEQVRLRGCVRSLADLQRAVVTLRMLEEVPGEDVARRLGITPGHVAVLLHRAKASLLTCMTTPGGPRAVPPPTTGSS